MKLKKGDLVVVIAGKDKGKKGKILKAMPSDKKVIVEGINLKKKHQKGYGQVKGGIIEREAPLDVSNVAYWDEKAKSQSRIGYEIGKKGEKIRIAKKSGSKIK